MDIIDLNSDDNAPCHSILDKINAINENVKTKVFLFYIFSYILVFIICV